MMSIQSPVTVQKLLHLLLVKTRLKVHKQTCDDKASSYKQPGLYSWNWKVSNQIPDSSISSLLFDPS